jgi:hypothetical protein
MDHFSPCLQFFNGNTVTGDVQSSGLQPVAAACTMTGLQAARFGTGTVAGVKTVPFTAVSTLTGATQSWPL